MYLIKQRLKDLTEVERKKIEKSVSRVRHNPPLSFDETTFLIAIDTHIENMVTNGYLGISMCRIMERGVSPDRMVELWRRYHLSELAVIGTWRKLMEERGYPQPKTKSHPGASTADAAKAGKVGRQKPTGSVFETCCFQTDSNTHVRGGYRITED